MGKLTQGVLVHERFFGWEGVPVLLSAVTSRMQRESLELDSAIHDLVRHSEEEFWI